MNTRRLTIRRLRLEDAAALHAGMSDPEVMRYWSTPPHQSLEDTVAWVRDSLAAGSPEFAVEFQGTVIGRVALWNGSEIGFFFVRRSWGHGYAAEALEAVCRWALTAGGVQRITADVDPRNARSLRVLERVGFVRTGGAQRTWCIGGEWCDSVYLELTAVTD